jgi:nucleoside-diphosphate-sugar epimerase
MKVFVAGASGAIGRRLLPLLTELGHEVVATTRSSAKARRLLADGVEPVVADGLDRNAVMTAVMRSEPEVVVHEMTGLTGMTDLRRFDAGFAVTNRLRTEGTDHLLEAARAAGVSRVVAQSFGNWNYERVGSGPKSEEDPLDPHPPRNQRRSIAAIRHLEAAVLETEGVDGVALRYANFYGPGTSFAKDGDIVDMLRKRRLPIVGKGTGVWSFIHVDDAAVATAIAIERGERGVYNIADDEPAPIAEWLPELARAMGARPPRRVPVLLGWTATGSVGVSMMTRIRGASNRKAKRALAWDLRYPSWRDGFREGLGDARPERLRRVP